MNIHMATTQDLTAEIKRRHPEATVFIPIMVSERPVIDDKDVPSPFTATEAKLREADALISRLRAILRVRELESITDIAIQVRADADRWLVRDKQP